MIGIWVLLLILTRIGAAWLSPLRPLTPLERALPAWPPVAPLPLWLERVLIAPWARWDAHWYARIATGVSRGDGTTQFYPFTRCWLCRWSGSASPMMALTLISLAAGLGAGPAFRAPGPPGNGSGSGAAGNAGLYAVPDRLRAFRPLFRGPLSASRHREHRRGPGAALGPRRPSGRPGDPHAPSGDLPSPPLACPSGRLGPPPGYGVSAPPLLALGDGPWFGSPRIDGLP